MQAAIELQVREKPRKKPGSALDNIVYGCYIIMRKLKSYRLEHFLDDSFLMPQYFLLCDLIREEQQEQEKELKKNQAKAKKGRHK